MRSIKGSILLLVIALLVTCGDSDGYVSLEEGAEYRVVSFGDAEFVPGIGQYISYKIAIFNEKNELIYRTNKLGIDKDEHILYTHNKNGVIQRNLSLFHLNDSISFRLSSKLFQEQFPEIKPESSSSSYRVEMKITFVEDELSRKNRLGALFFKAELNEEVLIQDYFIENKNIQDFKKWQGLYLKVAKKGDKKVAKYDNLILEYRAYFLDGKLFDEAIGKNVIKYSFGETAQVIEGLNMVISYLGVNSTSEIIIPSKFAFGDAGSSSELIPPSTPLRYELTVYADSTSLDQ